MYGIIGKIISIQGQRENLAHILAEGSADMPGCLSYVVAYDAEDENSIWISEVWEDKASHQESLSLPTVQEAISKGRPLISGFGERFETIPLGV